MMIKYHRLTDPAVEHSESPNRGGAINPEIIVLHYTASGGRDGSGDASYLSRASSRASAHTVVGRDGSQYQIIPFNRKAWHAGRSEYRGRRNVNDFSIGIEIDNWGWLRNGKSHAGVEVHPDNIFRGNRSGHSEWERYYPAQLAAVESQIAAICAKYRITDIVGHEDVSPGRKQDPGPALDEFMAAMKSKYVQNASPRPSPPISSREGEKEVTVDGLRLRARPWRGASIITHLRAGEVVIEQERDVYPGWSRIQRGNRIGYVANRYLR